MLWLLRAFTLHMTSPNDFSRNAINQCKWSGITTHANDSTSPASCAERSSWTTNRRARNCSKYRVRPSVTVVSR